MTPVVNIVAENLWHIKILTYSVSHVPLLQRKTFISKFDRFDNILSSSKVKLEDVRGWIDSHGRYLRVKWRRKYAWHAYELYFSVTFYGPDLTLILLGMTFMVMQITVPFLTQASDSWEFGLFAMRLTNQKAQDGKSCILAFNLTRDFNLKLLGTN